MNRRKHTKLKAKAIVNYAYKHEHINFAQQVIDRINHDLHEINL